MTTSLLFHALGLRDQELIKWKPMQPVRLYYGRLIPSQEFSPSYQNNPQSFRYGLQSYPRNSLTISKMM